MDSDLEFGFVCLDLYAPAQPLKRLPTRLLSGKGKELGAFRLCFPADSLPAPQDPANGGEKAGEGQVGIKAFERHV